MAPVKAGPFKIVHATAAAEKNVSRAAATRHLMVELNISRRGLSEFLELRRVSRLKRTLAFMDLAETKGISEQRPRFRSRLKKLSFQTSNSRI